MNPFVHVKEYEDSRRIVDYNCTFNTDTKLEFNILPEKRYLSLRDTLLTFSVEIPEELIPDNFLGATLFENLGIFLIKQTLITFILKRFSLITNSSRLNLLILIIM